MVGVQDTGCVTWTTSVGSITPGGAPLPSAGEMFDFCKAPSTASPKRGKKDSPLSAKQGKPKKAKI
jgi:hypothetical protein